MNGQAKLRVRGFSPFPHGRTRPFNGRRGWQAGATVGLLVTGLLAASHALSAITVSGQIVAVGGAMSSPDYTINAWSGPIDNTPTQGGDYSISPNGSQPPLPAIVFNHGFEGN